MLAALCFAAGVVLALLYLPQTGGGVGLSRTVQKTLPVALFALAAAIDGAASLLIAALAFSAAGDWALSRSGQRAFLAGMAAFAGAHLCYVALMLGLGGGWPVWGVGAVIGLLMLGGSTEIWLRPNTGALIWPVRGYVVVILMMGVAALMLPPYRWPALIGAALFVLSDLLLSLDVFVLRPGHRLRWWVQKTVWITYIGAQIGLVLGLMG